VRDGKAIKLGSKLSFALRKGDRLILETGGGAGYGDPTARSPAARERDIAMGFVSG
jgi:N-methylhydantoinase B